MTISKRILSMIVEELQPRDPQTVDSSIEEWDSLDRVEFLMYLEEEFSIIIQDEEAEYWKTVSDIIKTVSELRDVQL